MGFHEHLTDHFSPHLFQLPWTNSTCEVERRRISWNIFAEHLPHCAQLSTSCIIFHIISTGSHPGSWAIPTLLQRQWRIQHAHSNAKKGNRTLSGKPLGQYLRTSFQKARCLLHTDAKTFASVRWGGSQWVLLAFYPGETVGFLPCHWCYKHKNNWNDSVLRE